MSSTVDDVRLALLMRQPHIQLGETKECKLCRHPAHHFDFVDFNTACNSAPLARSGVAVEYFRCQRCELLFTDFFDEWSKEDFARYIYNADYADVDPEYTSLRPLRAADDLAPSLAGAEGLRILDYGSGSGVLETELTARGFAHVESYDPFSQPQRPHGLYNVITCMDVIEHSTTPRALFADILSFLAEGGCLLVGQTLQPADIDMQRGNWWYIAPRNGHVTTYSCETMRIYAEMHGLRFEDFGDLFALTGAKRSALTETIIARRHPQPRHLNLAAPNPTSGVHEAWHDAEMSPSGAFRWTRQAEVAFGAYDTPRGLLRVALHHLGSRDETFIAKSRIRVGGQERAIAVHEDTLFAVFDLPFAAKRDVVLVTPIPYSQAATGSGPDLRPVGLAIKSEEDRCARGGT